MDISDLNLQKKGCVISEAFQEASPVEEKSNKSRRISQISLHSTGTDIRKSEEESTYLDFLEEIVQESIESIRNAHGSKYYTEGIREIESTLFITALINTVESNKKSNNLPTQLKLFTDPVGLFSFQIINREYSCIRQSLLEENKQSLEKLQNEALRNLFGVINKQYSSNKTMLKEYPSREEVISLLIDQIDETSLILEKNKINKTVYGKEFPVHPARRGGLINWKNRYSAHIEEKFSHETGIDYEFSLPVVWLERSHSNDYLLVLIISGLDNNLLDDMVSDDHKCPEISLAIFDIRNKIIPVVIEELEYIIGQSYGRVLFSNMHYESNNALDFSLNNKSFILRNWITKASKGLEGVLPARGQRDIFDPFEFCQLVVENVLCSEIDGNDSEIYPFDRAIIIKESAGTIKEDLLEPLEIRFLEASIQSNKPEDRGRFLTRNERVIRETEDNECNPAMKKIKKENIFSFYLHQHPDGLVFSRKKFLTEEDKESVYQETSSSHSQQAPETRSYFIPNGDYEGESNVSSALFSIIGRLIPTNVETRPLKDPSNDKVNLFNILTFSKEFENIRLSTQQKYNEKGLLFSYIHGANFQEEFLLLHKIQQYYFDNINKAFASQNLQHINDRYKQYNLTKTQLEQIQTSVKKKQKDDKENAKIETSATSNSSKITMVSFSSELHDENVAFNTSKNDSEISIIPLNHEYNFTILLISDNDPEKTRAQLIHEKDDFELFISILLDRIYQDKRNEILRFSKRSQILNNSLNQFFHRFKSLVNEESKTVIENELKNLKPLLDLSSTHLEYVPVSGIADIFWRLIPEQVIPGNKYSEIDLGQMLKKKVSSLCPRMKIGTKDVDFSVQITPMPEIEVLWSSGVISEAFDNILKNAFEAAFEDTNSEHEKFVNLRLEIIPVNNNLKEKQYLDIIIENSGGPIPTSKLNKLNDNDPAPLDISTSKTDSTGLGIFISRYLLLNEIANGSDLIFMNLSGDVVQTRLRLPITIKTNLVVKETTKNESSSLKRDYVLYVEDTPDNYRLVVNELSSILDTLGFDLVHCRSYKDAVNYIKQKYPIALFMDLTILKGEDDSNPLMKNGLALFEYFCELSHNTKKLAPIWIMTNEKGSDVWDKLNQVVSDMHNFVITSDPSPDVLAKPGAIYILSEEIKDNKYPQKYPYLSQFFSLLQKDQSIEPSRKIDSHDLIEIPQSEIYAFDKKFIPTLKKNPSTIFIVKSNHMDENSLVSMIQDWFQHPGLPNPDPVFEDSAKLYKLTDHVYHQSILNVLVSQKSLRRKISRKFLYWALSRNIWLANSQETFGEIAYKWKCLKMEERGPLSKLRHDIKNKWGAWKLPSEIDAGHEIIPLVTNLETEVSFSPEQQKILEAIVSGKNLDSSLLFINDPQTTVNIRSGIRKIVGNLQVLSEASNEVFQVDITQMRDMLQILDDYMVEG